MWRLYIPKATVQNQTKPNQQTKEKHNRPRWFSAFSYTGEVSDPRPLRHLHLLGMQFSFQVFTKNLPMVHLLLLSKLTECVAAYRVMRRWAMPRLRPWLGTGKTLGEQVVHSHLVRITFTFPPQLLLPLQDGCGWEGSTESFINPERAVGGPHSFLIHLGSQLFSKVLLVPWDLPNLQTLNAQLERTLTITRSIPLPPGWLLPNRWPQNLF